MINAKKNGKSVRVEVRGDVAELMSELSHAAYAAACGMLDANDNRLDPEGAALFMMSLLEGIDLVYRDMTGDKRGYLDRCERLILMRMANPGRLQQETDACLSKEGVLQ